MARDTLDKKQYMKKYYQEHRAQYKKYDKKYRKNHKTQIKEYYQEHKMQIKEWEKKRYQKYKQIMHDLKTNGCAICGYDKCDAALSFHHTNSEDKIFYLITRNMKRTNKSIIEELNKCILLCANCHREIHDKERHNE